MTAELHLADLSRRQLEDLILVEHSLLRRVLDAVRENAKPEWKVRREVERLVDEAQDRRPLRIAIVRAADTNEQARAERLAAERNAQRWGRWGP